MSQVNPIQLQKYLSGVGYPIDREGLIEAARGNDADDDILEQLEQMPDRTYYGPNEVSEAVSR